MKGTYLLAIYLQEDSDILVGALGSISFKKGFYVYIGSALGEKGSATLMNRVKRHISSPIEKKIHWHIDYLLSHEGVIILRLYLIPSNQKLECEIAKETMEKADEIVKDFGSSDCDCPSHLFYFEKDFPWD